MNLIQKIKYETPNLRIKGINLERPKGDALDLFVLSAGLYRKWWGLETDNHLYERYRETIVNMIRKKS